MTSSNGNHPSRESLSSLAHGIVAGSEREDLLSHVRDCERCEDDLRDLVRVRERARVGLPLAHGKNLGLRPKSTQRLRFAAIGAIAAIVAAFVVVIGLRGGDREFTPSEYWLPTDYAAATMRASGGAIPEQLRLALESYESHEPAVAIAALSNVELKGSLADLRDVYLSAALVNAGHFQRAEAILEGLDVLTLPYEYRQSCRWYRYVLLSSTDRVPAARVQLEELTQDPGPVGAHARAEQRRIKGHDGVSTQGRP